MLSRHRPLEHLALHCAREAWIAAFVSDFSGLSRASAARLRHRVGIAGRRRAAASDDAIPASAKGGFEALGVFEMFELIFLFWLPMCAIVGVAAARRYDRNGVGWFFLSVLISPLLGLGFLLASGPKPDASRRFNIDGCLVGGQRGPQASAPRVPIIDRLSEKTIVVFGVIASGRGRKPALYPTLIERSVGSAVVVDRSPRPGHLARRIGRSR